MNSKVRLKTETLINTLTHALTHSLLTQALTHSLTFFPDVTLELNSSLTFGLTKESSTSIPKLTVLSCLTLDKSSTINADLTIEEEPTLKELSIPLISLPDCSNYDESQVLVTSTDTCSANRPLIRQSILVAFFDFDGCSDNVVGAAGRVGGASLILTGFCLVLFFFVSWD